MQILLKNLTRLEKQKRDSYCSQERTATQKAGYKNNPPSSSTGGLPDREKKKDYRLNFPSTNRHVRVENVRCLLNQLPPFIRLIIYVSAQNSLCRSKKTIIRGKMLEKVQDKFNLLCLNRKRRKLLQTI